MDRLDGRSKARLSVPVDQEPCTLHQSIMLSRIPQTRGVSIRQTWRLRYEDGEITEFVRTR
jgi:hypothetical protein